VKFSHCEVGVSQSQSQVHVCANTSADRGLCSLWVWHYDPHKITVFSVRCNIYISHFCYDVSVRPSVCLSVTEVNWQTQIQIYSALSSWGGVISTTSRAMLATARPSCFILHECHPRAGSYIKIVL